MTNYIIVMYRPNGSDYYRNCLQGSSNSALEIQTTDDFGTAAGFVADKLYQNKVSERRFSNWEVTVFIDGYTDGIAIFNNLYTTDYDRACDVELKIDNVITRARIIAEGMIAEHRLKLEVEKMNQEKAEAERRRTSELAQLKHLKEKYGE